MELLTLFWSFFKIGIMTFGGGYAMLPFLERELVTNKNWITSEELMDYYAISQCTPGVIAVNCATFVGYKRKGIIGGIVATAGVILPSLIIIVLLAAVLKEYGDNPYVKKAFVGIRIAVTVLVFNAILKLKSSALKDFKTVLIFIASGVAGYFLGISPLIIIAAGALGVVFNLIGGKKEE